MDCETREAVASQPALQPLDSSAPSLAASLSEQDSSKVTQILQACSDGDLNALATLATSARGFVQDEVRRTAWPVMLGCNPAREAEQSLWSVLPAHGDEEQVKLDVNRSFIYYPNDQSSKQLEHRKQELSDLITEVLRRHPSLCYFQGYHDIVQVLLLVLGVDRAPPAVARLSLLRIRDFMLPSLSAATDQLRLLPSVLSVADPILWRHLQTTRPFFALSATLTLYAHDIQEYGAIARLFDFLLAREAVMSIYLFATIILSRKKELLEIPPDEPDMLHFTLSKLPQPLDMDSLILKAASLFESHPPESLPHGAWRGISKYSVLKTTRDSSQLIAQSLEDGERFWTKQAAQVRRRELYMSAVSEFRKKSRKYRRPIRFVGVAIAVAVLSWWIGKNGGFSKGAFSALHETFGKFRTALGK